MQSTASPPERRAQATSRDSALRRLRGLRWFVAALTLALAAGFAVLAYAATPPYQKKRHVEVALRSPSSTTTRKHHRRHHRHHRPKQPQAPAASSSASATPSAPVAPAPVAPQPVPVQPQPPAAAPAPTPQPPVTNSGGS